MKTLTSEEYAKLLRTRNKSIIKDYIKLHAKEAALEELCTQCSHEHVIILHSAYRGSHSWDYEDCYPEGRLCLVCGKKEYHDEKNSFKYLLNPFARFEEGGKLIKLKKKLPIDDPLNQTLASLIKYCKKEGYKT